MNLFTSLLASRWLRAALTWVVLVGMMAGLSSCRLSQQTAPADGDLEAQVLQIIRDNPEVLIESVQTYQEEKQERLKQASQDLTTQMQSNPQAVIGSSPVTGSPDKKLVLIEFSDFQCPYCARAYQTVKEFMKKHGQEVTLVYKHLPLTNIHPQAMSAAQAAWAANQQGQFWPFHDALFENQSRLSEEYYQELAGQLGLDLNRFNKDRQSKQAQAAIEQDMQMAENLGIGGTPYFILNGLAFSGAQPLQNFEQALDKAKQGSPTP
ncbi:MAG: thioredoxin domain-containing protein [Cyanobacteriota bacterium]|nr:thioredoxin domain-containing protein [Cyanobacteriota bacterium]